MQGVKREVYKQSMTAQEATAYIKAVGYPVMVLLLSMFTISLFAQFGTRLIAPMTAAMWALGVFESIIIRSMRKEITKQTLAFIGIYQITLLTWRQAIKIVSNVTTEQIMASYNQVITLSQSSAFPGYLQAALWATAVAAPIGYIGMQGKRLFTFAKNPDKDKTIRQYRSIR